MSCNQLLTTQNLTCQLGFLYKVGCKPWESCHVLACSSSAYWLRWHALLRCSGMSFHVFQPNEPIVLLCAQNFGSTSIAASFWLYVCLHVYTSTSKCCAHFRAPPDYIWSTQRRYPSKPMWHRDSASCTVLSHLIYSRICIICTTTWLWDHDAIWCERPRHISMCCICDLHSVPSVNFNGLNSIPRICFEDAPECRASQVV